MSILSGQLLTALVLLLGTLFCGILPAIVLWWRNGRSSLQISAYSGGTKSSKILSFLMCVGGGVLFATCFVHMLPEVLEHFEDEDSVKQKTHLKDENDTLSKNGNDTLFGKPEEEEEVKTISMPMVFVSLGFFCVFIIEEVLHEILHSCQKSKHSGDALPSVSFENHVSHLAASVIVRGTNRETGSIGGTSPAMHAINDVRTPSSYHTCDNLVTEESDPGGSAGLAGMVRGILIVAALSFHSLFEGMAVGLQKSEKDIWTTGMAIAVHKFVIAFAVGLEIYSQSRRILSVVVYLLVFALMSPIGILIVILAGTRGQPDSSDHTINVLSAMATGTLLYIVFMEILQRDQHKQLPGLMQLLAVALGWGVMAAIQALTAKYDAD